MSIAASDSRTANVRTERKVKDELPLMTFNFKDFDGEVAWGTIQRIGGQKPRLAGYVIGSVFYPVFLDKDHLFFPSKKKHT